ncbi:patatin-like phospholipase family protein [Flavobacterium undicola]|uniref:patatin-like phospholipase family protein n=1 Tax=Flavobacterium undicola TaxID=1932779 RepID=UPI001376E4FF|nr:patatin-like phospholipase family protein [Flavobacterium undicola]MBA0885163.1 patatin-like phospholipase family protein [Flavobacterium undicola]
MKTKIGIVLSGGGARGIAHLGMLKALEEFGIKASHISGTSAGAIAGAFYAAGYSANEILTILKKGHIFSFSNLLIKRQGLFAMKGFHDIYIECFPTNSFDDLKIPLYITATDILKGELVYFSSGNLSQALMASSCLPLLFQPINYNDTLYVDGGVINNFPIEPLMGQCDIIIGSYVNSIKKEVDKVGMNNILDRCFHLAMKSSVEQKTLSCNLYFEPPNMSQFSLYNLKNADEIFEYSYQYALTLEDQIKALDIQL